MGLPEDEHLRRDQESPARRMAALEAQLARANERIAELNDRLAVLVDELELERAKHAASFWHRRQRS